MRAIDAALRNYMLLRDPDLKKVVGLPLPWSKKGRIDT
jgi:hypothetical protein